MKKFIKGEIIQCMEDSSQRVLKQGKLYTCRGYIGDKVLIEEYKRFGFKENRFRGLGIFKS